MRQSALRGKTGPGRPAGRTGQAKDNIAECFEMLGGIEGMVKWALNHRTEFYRKIYPKLIGVEVPAKTAEAPKQDAESVWEAFERALLRIRASRQDSVMADHDPRGGAAPESAVARTNGSAAVDKRSG